jgi:hypothetical protein
MTVYPPPNCSQVQVTPAGASPAWLSLMGHVTGLKYSYSYPGGDDKASCVFEAPAALRSRILELGATVRIFRGGHSLWSGRLDEPVPLSPYGWQLTAVGVGNQPADYAATWSAWPSGQPDEVINNAIGRGLPIVNPSPGVGQPSGIWLGQQPDTASRTLKDVLDLCCTRGGLGWYINGAPGGPIGNDISLGPLPTAVTRLLVCNAPVPRTSGGDVKLIWIKYQSAADNVASSAAATYAVTSVTNPAASPGGSEQYLDLSNAGVLSSGAAQAVAAQILKIYQRSSFAGPFPVPMGSLLTTGGVPADPGCEQAGGVWRLILTDYAYGGEPSPLVPPQFIAGGYEWDDQNQAGTVTPYQTLDQSLSGLLGAPGATGLNPISVA